MQELREQTHALLHDAESPPAEVYPHRIAFNVLPQVETFKGGDDYTTEERKMMAETRKILGASEEELGISATCVRVPVLNGESESVNVQTREPLSPEECRELLARAPGVVVVDAPADGVYPLASEAAGRDEVLVGRIRRDPSHERCLNMWIVGDNLRKGAATNAVQVAELLHERGLIRPRRAPAPRLGAGALYDPRPCWAPTHPSRSLRRLAARRAGDPLAVRRESSGGSPARSGWPRSWSPAGSRSSCRATAPRWRSPCVVLVLASGGGPGADRAGAGWPPGARRCRRAALALLAASIPFIVNERVGILGVGLVNDDMAYHLLIADWLEHAGRRHARSDPPGLPGGSACAGRRAQRGPGRGPGRGVRRADAGDPRADGAGRLRGA